MVMLTGGDTEDKMNSNIHFNQSLISAREPNGVAFLVSQHWS